MFASTTRFYHSRRYRLWLVNDRKVDISFGACAVKTQAPNVFPPAKASHEANAGLEKVAEAFSDNE